MWTDSEYYLSKRDTLGILWDDLPAIGIYTSQRYNFAYHKDKPLNYNSLVRWLKEATEDNDTQDAEKIEYRSDKTIYKYFLD